MISREGAINAWRKYHDFIFDPPAMQGGSLTFHLMSFIPPLKPFLTFRQQAELLVSRGMSSAEELSQEELVANIEADLAFINYYRMSAYWYAYRKKQPTGELTDVFKTKTYWETVRGLYMFDRRVRGMIFDAISRIEIALRTQIAHTWARSMGVSAPQKDTNCYNTSYTISKGNKQSMSDYAALLSKVDSYYHKVYDDAAKHHMQVYGINKAADLPVWVFVEYTTFGNLASLLSGGLPHAVVSSIASSFGFSDTKIFISSINLLNNVRNTCAHQGRVWNRYWLTMKGAHYMKNPAPCFPEWEWEYSEASAEWTTASPHTTCRLCKNNYQTAAVLTICNILLRTAAPHSCWKNRVKNFVSDSKNPLPDMYRYLGFANAHWHEHPLWQ